MTSSKLPRSESNTAAKQFRRIDSRSVEETVLEQQSKLPANRSAALSARDLVMIEYQRSSMEMTRNFLESQQRVMLAYLNRSPLSPQNSGADKSGMGALSYESRQEQNSYQFDATPFASQSFSYASAESRSQELMQPPTPQAAVPELPPASVLQDTPSFPPSADAVSSPDELIEALVAIVAERTGYPPEMLDPSLDLEADLGIDSIKRVEILNGFRRLLPEEKQNALEDGIERLAGVKTLQGIMDWIRSDLNSEAPSQSSASHSAEIVVAHSPELDATLSLSVAGRTQGARPL